MLSCITPHVCEEMYSRLSGKDTIVDEPWPTYEESMLQKQQVEVIAQVNGKLRSKFMVNADADEETIKQSALTLPNVLSQLAGKTIRKVIVVKGKVVNFVAN